MRGCDVFHVVRHEDLVLETDLLLLVIVLIAHACEGRSLQAGTSEMAIAIHIRRSTPARQPTGGSQGQTSFGRVSLDLILSIHHATHHLDGEAYHWWLDLQENPSTDLAAISWKRFKELLLAHYFPTSVKRKMEQDSCNLRQGDRTVAEYEREFSRLLHCVPFVVRDDKDKARIFKRGLRSSIFRFVQSPTSKPTGRW
uniref:Retrotransposon gag domain-containing protein n=1 Tax=Ananas comosus var. bracteatus TaxID=296719 RepID=A0A6V7QBT6_ANACO|nr:unnamed protein product [Ananas comosus var. bracteatus]